MTPIRLRLSRQAGHRRGVAPHHVRSMLVGLGAAGLTGLWVLAQSAPTASVEQTVAGTRFRTLPGFVVERLNPPDQTDSYVVLTFDADGQPVVAREFDVPLRLIDRDGDGIYESEETITDGLNTCQGLWFDGPTMYANCHATVTPEEAEALQTEVADAIAGQEPVGGSLITGGRGVARGGGAGGGRGAAAPGGGAGRGAAPAGGGAGRAGGNPFGGGRTNGPAALLRVTGASGSGPAVVERVAQLAGGVEDHGPHAIRRGPDGSMMVFSGNNGGTPLNRYLDPDSLVVGDTEAQLLPVLGPGGFSQREGVHSALYRVDPDAARYTVVTGGNRNTYDFAFNLLGEAFWYDSDNEPEIGVPWYREVRTVHGIPGGNYGYRDLSGKLPPWYIDTLPPLRDLDRGSPTGEETYQAYAYPREFFDMLLEADWSRGRLLYTTLTRRGATYEAMEGAPEFLHGEPLNITDVEVGPDGLVYFTTGGRRTAGGFWRIRYTGATPPQPDRTGIMAVVNQPQPLSAWGWAAIEGVKAAMGESAFGTALERVARDTSADAMDRVRALYEMLRHGPVPGDALLQALANDSSADVRSAVAFVSGRRQLRAQVASASTEAAAAILRDQLDDADAMVRRRALEAIVALGQRPDRPSLVPVDDIYAQLGDDDRFVRWSARIALEHSPRSAWADRVLAETDTNAVMEGMLAWVRTAPEGTSLDPVLDKQFDLMRDTSLGTEDTLRLLRTFHYTVTELPEAGLDDARREELFGLWANRFPANDERLNWDIALTLGYSQQPGAIAEILAAMPAGDTNQILTQQYLYALRYVRTGWTTAQKMQVADIFASTAGWRGGMGIMLPSVWDAFMEFYTDAEREQAYQRAPNYAPLDPSALAAAGRGGGGGIGGRRGGILASREEWFESLMYRADQFSGGRGGSGNPAEDGRVVFEAQCASCHKAGDVGMSTGTPDLTGNALTRGEILEAIIWPDRQVDEAYRPTVVETTDGRTLRGVVVSESGGTIRLKTSDEADPIEVAASSVRTRRQEAGTIMPDLFDELSQNDMNALVVFLQSR